MGLLQPQLQPSRLPLRGLQVNRLCNAFEPDVRTLKLFTTLLITLSSRLAHILRTVGDVRVLDGRDDAKTVGEKGEHQQHDYEAGERRCDR